VTTETGGAGAFFDVFFEAIRRVYLLLKTGAFEVQGALR
jgi:hypothetical protein